MNFDNSVTQPPTPGRFRALAPLLAGLAVLAAGPARAQTATSQFATGVTAPQGSAILSGAAISPATGRPVRHFWSADVNGLCRLDPDVDTPGAHIVNTATCLTSVVGGIRFLPGQLAFDPTTNNLYAVDAQGKSLGVFRLHFVPTGDNGQGLIDTATQEIVGGSGVGAAAVNNCGLGANQPSAAALGPDGNLYLGFRRNGNIVRILAPQTQPLPCSNVQTIGATPDRRRTQGLAWVGHDMYGIDGASPMVFPNGDQCFTPVNGNSPCFGRRILASAVGAPTEVASDQTYPSLNGNNLYLASLSSVTRVNTATSTITGNFGGAGFSFISALQADSSDPANPMLYVGDDPSNGIVPGQGRWSLVTNGPSPAVATLPSVPFAVTATAGNGQAVVTWVPILNGAPVVSYTVRNSFASNGVLVPDVVVTAAAGAGFVPTTATVTGLTNGVSYQFEVIESNAIGSSPPSAPSNIVTPQAPTVPGAPLAVLAIGGNAQATVAWAPPVSNGGTPITGYTVTVLAGGVATGLPVSVAPTPTSAVITGLTNGVTYTFTVHATNALGNGPESLPSNPVTPALPPPPPDVTITSTGPATVAFGSLATYTLTVSNVGAVNAQQVIVTDTLPSLGAVFVSGVATQGTCFIAGSVMTCNLGAMAAGASANVTIVARLISTSTNTASLQVLDGLGNTLTNLAVAAAASTSVTTTVPAPLTTTDIQVTGAAQNGGPAAGGVDTYTWQVKNGGSQVANAVAFANTLPAGVVFESVTSNIGSCLAPPPGTPGGAVACTANSLAVGQTMIVTISVSVPKAGTFASTGVAAFGGIDTNLANNSFTVNIQVK